MILVVCKMTYAPTYCKSFTVKPLTAHKYQVFSVHNKIEWHHQMQCLVLRSRGNHSSDYRLLLSCNRNRQKVKIYLSIKIKITVNWYAPNSPYNNETYLT